MRNKLKSKLIPIAIGDKRQLTIIPVRTLPSRFWSIAFCFRWLSGSFIILILMNACTQNKEAVHQADVYTCPMHLTVIRGKPGTCPVCAMELVRKGQPREEVKITGDLNYLLKPTNAMVITSIKTVMPVQKSMDVTTKANGIITYDTRRFTLVPIRFGGRIEKLSIKYNFQPMRKGQKILEIYSPDLLTAQRDLLYLINSDKENSQIIEGAKEKLRLLGVSDSQINQLVSTGQEAYSFSVFSPVSGYIVEEGALAAAIPISPGESPNASMNVGTASGGSSNVQQTSNSLPSELLTREGMYVSTGQVIFKVVNTEYVWAEFDVYQRDAAFIKVNGPVQITLDNTTDRVEAKVSFIQPFFKNGESFTKVRVYLQNLRNMLRIGQLVTASFTTLSTGSIWIPLSARLDLGTKEIAFIKRREVFRPKAIITARQSGDWVEVLNGLDPTDSLAYNAQFMVDSESFIKVRN